jgi:branched-chain amino acid transport system substrate-binding protein
MSKLVRGSTQIVAGAATVLLIAACGGVKDANSGAGATQDVAAAKLVAPVSGMECKEGTEPTGEPIVVGGSLSPDPPIGVRL